jgi:hypothetical protein
LGNDAESVIESGDNEKGCSLKTRDFRKLFFFAKKDSVRNENPEFANIT